jgi:hypothetical protein
MDFINIITSFIQRVRTEFTSDVERSLFGLHKAAKVHPTNKKNDIETGLYHGEDMCRITIHYSSTEECKWDAGGIL